MKNNEISRPEKIVVINGRHLQFVYLNGQWWVAIKPICEALDVNYDWQKKAIKEHKILSQLVWKTTLTGSDGKRYEMLCLPEKFIYGWIFALQSNSPALLKYQQTCYEVLYDYFHGATHKRTNTLYKEQRLEMELEQIEKRLAANTDYAKIDSIKKELKEVRQNLNRQDLELINPQLDLFSEKPLKE